jgi:serine phosphatase RsbU (regulator of sigma subunit)/tetratricopeptide (TPR) repeat protein
MKNAVIFLVCFFVAFNVIAQKDSLSYFLNSSKHDTIKALELNSYADRLANSGNSEDAIEILQKSCELAFKKGNSRIYIKSQKYKAFLLIRINRYDEATKILNELLKYSLKNNSLIGQAYSKRLLAMIEMHKGNFDVSIKKYIETQKLWENTKDSTLIVNGLGDLGVVFYYQKDYENAIRYWEKTSSYYIAHNNEDLANSVLSNLALAYIDVKKYDDAEKIFTSVLPRAIAANDFSTVINIYTNLSALEHARGNLDKAIAYTTQSIKALESTGEISRIGSLYCNMGEFYRLKKEYIKSKENLFTGLDLIRRSENLSELSHAYQNLAALFLDMKNFEFALAYKDTFYAINDSIYTLDKQAQIMELEKRFNSQQKEEQISLLNKDKIIQNSELKKQRYLIYFFTIGSVLLFVLVFFIYRSYKIKRIANLKLEIQKKEIWNQKTLAEEQKQIIEEKNKEIIDSITYAKRIQNAMLTNDGYINEEMKNVNAEHFILFKPKDIVSGDFYWFYKLENHFFYVTADCTGHGVPGGFMSMLGINLLNEIVIERKITEPGAILNSLREEIIKALKTDKEFTKDGMDATVCKINFDTNVLEYSAANNSFYVIREGELIEQKAQKMPVGYMEKMQPFNTKTFQLLKGDSIYTFTDGYADQFGGPKGKKFMYKNLEKMLIENKDMSLDVQKEILLDEFEKWKGINEQIDDVCIIGVRI